MNAEILKAQYGIECRPGLIQPFCMKMDCEEGYAWLLFRIGADGKKSLEILDRNLSGKGLETIIEIQGVLLCRIAEL